nr:reverse transcriptase domain-containing protein [Tanacetum cinerariifolium]GEY96103.1 reverse transcriptase domain-containing protein [Tanacetum cinerariifolium]
MMQYSRARSNQKISGTPHAPSQRGQKITRKMKSLSNLLQKKDEESSRRNTTDESWSRIHTLGRANAALSYFQLGDEGSSSGGTKLNSTFITAKQAKTKATLRKLAYADSDKEAPTRSRRLEDRSTTKEKARRERSKSREKSSKHQEISLDFEHEEGLKDAYEDLNSPHKRPKPTPFTQRITRYIYHRRAKLPRKIRAYEGNKDPQDHLGIFSVAAEQEEWPMPVWCKMLRQTLGGATRNWFDDLDPKSVDSFEELSLKFLKNFHNKKDMLKTRQKFTELRGGRMKACKLSWTDSNLKVHTSLLQKTP